MSILVDNESLDPKSAKQAEKDLRVVSLDKPGVPKRFQKKTVITAYKILGDEGLGDEGLGDEGVLLPFYYGRNVLGKVRFSYEYNCRGLYFRPQVGLFGDYSVIDGFSESSSSKRRITFDRGSVGFLYGEAALALGLPISCGCGVILPEVKGGYAYDFINDSMRIDAFMPQYLFTQTDFKIDTINKSYYFIRGGISFGVFGDTKIGAYYEGVYSGDKWNNHSWRIAFNSGF